MATQQTGRLWAALDVANLDGSWATIAPRMLQLVVAALLEAARGSQDYVAAVVRAWGVDPDPVGRVVESTFARTASDGRALDSLLGVPVFESQAFIDQGMDRRQAVAIGRRHLDRIVATQVADAARVPTAVAQVNDRAVRGYVRMVTPPACSRCVVLAGRWYATNTGFLRHPQCDCTMIPAAEYLPDVSTDPRRYFDSLSSEEQDRAFTKAGAQAIRDGSDLARVVNARRGMYTAGGRKFTREATTRRGINRRVRLMPEQIYLEAGGSRDEAIRLLKLHGYIL